MASTNKIRVHKSKTKGDDPEMLLYTFYLDDDKEMGHIAFKDDYIKAFFIEPDYRRPAVEKLMLKCAIQKGLTQLDVAKNNLPAINLYKTLEFTITGETEINGVPSYHMSFNTALPKSVTVLAQRKSEVLQDLKNNFKTLSQSQLDTSDAYYLLPDGTFLDTQGPNDSDHQHVNIANYIQNKYKVDDRSDNDGLDLGGSAFMNLINAIRITPWVPAITIPLTKISELQDEELTELMNRWVKAKKVNISTPVQIGVAGKSIYYLRAPKIKEIGDEFAFGFAISDIINNYYKSHNLTENIHIKKKQIAAQKDKKYNYNYLPKKHNSTTLKEDTRAALLNKSKGVGGYKDTSRGKNRFERKKFSKISSSVKEYNKINMNNLFKSDLLQVNIPVVGETDEYTVSVKMDGVIAEIQKNIKNNHNKFEFRTVIQALTKIFNTTNIYVKCTCADYKYNYAHWNIINNVSIDDTAHDPGPGKGIKNPHDDKGRGCKHVLLVLDNGDWLMKVASVINNYVHYAEKNLSKPFLNIIFPKLYGIDAENAVEEGLIDTDKYLTSTAGFIDAINEYGKNATSKKPAKVPEEEE